MSDRPNDAPAPDAASTESPSRDAPPALDDLRAAIHRATDEMERLRRDARRLRDENERLRQRVHELEENPSAGRDGTALLLNDDPDALRQRIDHFIGTLDAHLSDA